MSDHTPPKWWYCSKHGDAMPKNAWGCPDCVVELRALVSEQAIEIQKLRDALNIAGGALYRISPACIEDDEERECAEHVRSVGLAAVTDVIKRPTCVERGGINDERSICTNSEPERYIRRDR